MLTRRSFEFPVLIIPQLERHFEIRKLSGNYKHGTSENPLTEILPLYIGLYGAGGCLIFRGFGGGGNIGGGGGGGGGPIPYVPRDIGFPSTNFSLNIPRIIRPLAPRGNG